MIPALRFARLALMASVLLAMPAGMAGAETAAEILAAQDPVYTPVTRPYPGPAIGEMKTHKTVYEDTLIQIARDNDLGFVEMRSANPGVDPWLPGAGVELTIPTMQIIPDAPRKGIIINLPEMRLYAFTKNDVPPVSFPIGIGRDGLETPMGTTTVVRKTIGPVWRPTERMRREKPELPVAVKPGSDNPMGTHALYLGWPTYAMHGTNKPYGIGRRSSSGCIRLYPEDIIRLYDMIPVGTPVTVVNQPIKLAWIGDDLYLEAHATMAQAAEIEKDGRMPTFRMSSSDVSYITSKAGAYAASLDWDLIRKIMADRPGYPIVVGKKTSGAAATTGGAGETGGKAGQDGAVHANSPSAKSPS